MQSTRKPTEHGRCWCRPRRDLPHAVAAADRSWRYVPFPVRRLTPHSLSRRVRDLLAGDLGVHRDMPVDTDDQPQEQPAPSPVGTRVVYSRGDAQRAWERRRTDLKDIAGVEAILNDVDARAKELHQRTAAILAAETDAP